jgi:hypothetical protein
MVSFDQTLDSGSASNPGLYSVDAPVKKRGKTTYNKGVAVRGVDYNVNTQVVTITLAKPYKGVLQVTVQGGVLAANGASSTGVFTQLVR